jgi:hypothetical protein
MGASAWQKAPCACLTRGGPPQVQAEYVADAAGIDRCCDTAIFLKTQVTARNPTQAGIQEDRTDEDPILIHEAEMHDVVLG